MIKGNKNQNNRKIRVPAPSVAKQMFSFSEQSVSGFWSVFVCLRASAFGLSEQAADPADQGLDEGVTGADLAVQAFHLQQLPLKSLSETCSHVALQLHTDRHKTGGSVKIQP